MMDARTVSSIAQDIHRSLPAGTMQERSAILLLALSFLVNDHERAGNKIDADMIMDQCKAAIGARYRTNKEAQQPN